MNCSAPLQSPQRARGYRLSDAVRTVSTTLSLMRLHRVRDPHA